MAPTPVALPPCLPTELISFILTQSAYPTTLIICTSRASFLSSVLESIYWGQTQAGGSPTPRFQTSPNYSERDIEPRDGYQAPNDVQHEENTEQTRHPLLVPSLQQLAAARHVTTVFIPTVSHLRAYLSTFPLAGGPVPGPLKAKPFDKPSSHSQRLVVYNMVSLHRDTSEWSAQGMGGSTACLVEAGFRTGAGVVLVEGRDTDGLVNTQMMQEGKDITGGEDKDEDDNGDEIGSEKMEGDVLLEGDVETEARDNRQEVKRGCRKRAEKLWREGMPMLNGSARRAALDIHDGSGGPSWGGRTVEVRSVLGRWFKFGQDDYWEEAGLA
jgi:hypothetical protein